MKKKIEWLKTHHEYTIFLIAIAVIALSWVAGYWWEFAVIPPEKFTKIAFAVIALSIGGGCAWIWLSITPQFKNAIDPDAEDEENGIDQKLTKWQKTKIGFGFFALFVICYTLLVIF